MEEDQRCINTEYNISKRKEYRPMNPELDSGTKILPAGPRAYTMSSIHTYSSLLRRNDSNPLSRIHTVEKFSRRGCVWSCARDIYRNYSISFQTPLHSAAPRENEKGRFKGSTTSTSLNSSLSMATCLSILLFDLPSSALELVDCRSESVGLKDEHPGVWLICCLFAWMGLDRPLSCVSFAFLSFLSFYS